MRLPGFDGRRASSDQPSAGVLEPAPSDVNTPRVIVVSADNEFYGRLQRIASNCYWRIVRAASTDEVKALIGCGTPVPMVLYEGVSNDEWQDAFRRLNDSPTPPCVLLVSNVSDDYLLQEVVRNHGYDILPKSAPNEKLIRCINFAWLWTLGRGRGRS